MKSIDWKEVAFNSQMCKDFTIQVFNKFQLLSSTDVETENIEDIYSKLIKSTEEVALATLPKKKRRSELKPTASQRVVDARTKLKSISSAYHKDPSQTSGVELNMAKKQLDDAYLDAEVDYISGKIDDLSRYHISNKHHLAWKTVKDLAGKNNTSSVRIKGGSAKKRLENWANHFKNLLGKKARLPEGYTLPMEQVSGPLPINTNQFSLSELEAVIKQQKSSKAFGPDNIPALIWKDPQFHTLLLDICNHAFSTHSTPSIWHKSQIIPMQKKGDLSLATN